MHVCYTGDSSIAYSYTYHQNENITVYIYDESGSPIGMQYHGLSYAEDEWDIYWYTKNLQGDISGVYRDTVFNGNQTIYNVCSAILETVVIAGAAVCGNYLSVNCTMKGAVQGTECKVTLTPGTTIDRYGSQYGRYLTDSGTPISQLALTPGNSCKLTTYVVNRPLVLKTGVVAPCAWGPGGGVQYFSWMSVQRLVRFGFLTPII